jgi:hypothetical protein
MKTQIFSQQNFETHKILQNGKYARFNLLSMAHGQNLKG